MLYQLANPPLVETHAENLIRLYVRDTNGAPVSGARIKVWAGPPPTGNPPYFVDEVPFRTTNSAGLLEFFTSNAPMPESRDYWIQIIDANNAPQSDLVQCHFPQGSSMWIMATLQSADTSSSSDLEWDARLTNELNIVMQPSNVTNGQWYWKLIRAIHLPPGNVPGTAQGRVNMYYTVLDQDGRPVPGQRVWQDWGDERAPAQTDQDGNANFGMTGDSSFDPKRNERGPYLAYVDGPSDVVEGLGLPLRQHVVYEMTWRWTKKGAASNSSIVGRIIGAPAGTQLTLNSGTFTRMVMPDGTGSFGFTGLPAGTYTVSMNGAGVLQSNIVLDGTNTVRVDYTFALRNSRVSGTITNAPTNTQVTLASSANVFTAMADASGNYMFANISAGTYSLAVNGNIVNPNVVLDGANAITFNYTLSMLPPTKPLTHYLLFGSPNLPNTQTDLILALDYIARFAPTVGFSVDEAQNAQNVTVVGRAIDPGSEQALKSTGCVVRHIDGADSYAVAQLFAQLIASGNPYL